MTTEYFIGFRSIREIQLKKNRFQDNSFENVPRRNISYIEFLDISHNQIKTVGALLPVLGRSPHIKLLNVSFNKISKFERISSSSLLSLDVSGNPLPHCVTEIKQETSNNLSGLEIINKDAKVCKGIELV